MAAGGSHSLALTSSGGVLGWGNNELGQLGDGSRISRSAPSPVPGLEPGVVAIVAGPGRSLARKGLILLLQVDSDDEARTAWGDLGRLYFLIDTQGLRAQRFDAARCAWQSH